ncbi:MAG: hypothetical protein U0325_14050 [Polyangiales bacterium]
MLIFRTGIYTRWFVSSLVLVAFALFGAMTLLALRELREERLLCSRSSAGLVTCAVQQLFPMGMIRSEVLPTLRDVRTLTPGYSRIRGAPTDTVLVLELSGGGAREFWPEGWPEPRAREVAASVRGLLNATAPPPQSGRSASATGA